jgi:hypothetical protein
MGSRKERTANMDVNSYTRSTGVLQTSEWPSPSFELCEPKLSDVMDLRPTVSAGYASSLHCHFPSTLMQEPCFSSLFTEFQAICYC